MWLLFLDWLLQAQFRLTSNVLVLPLIVTAMILAVQRLRAMSGASTYPCSLSIIAPYLVVRPCLTDRLDRRKAPGSLDCRLLRCDNAYRDRHQHHPHGPGLGQTDARGQRRQPRSVRRGPRAH
jgi:hypothetical protein